MEIGELYGNKRIARKDENCKERIVRKEDICLERR